jgi:ABC-type protease/lipase transport system fused ATPase/permease subunit
MLCRECPFAVIRRQTPAPIAFSLLASVLWLFSAIGMLQRDERVLASGSMVTLLWLTVAAPAAICALFKQGRRMIFGHNGAWLWRQSSGLAIRQSMEAGPVGATGADARQKDGTDLGAFIAGNGVQAFLAVKR